MTPTESPSTAPQFLEAEDAPPKRKRSACTCIVLVACSIAGLLLVLLILPNLLQGFAPDQAKAMIGVLKAKAALEAYAADHGGQFPGSLDSLVQPGVDARWSLRDREALLDPWGREYLYEPPGEAHAGPRVYSLGRDGRPGGRGEDEDIDSLEIRFKERSPGRDRPPR
jgi:general secretion pathway protein G